ncbi:MAG TPA: fumarylacetoacetase [Gemmatimonadales bacterium]|jgi:fumarylacetoacetase
MIALDRSHDPARTSWVVSANGHADFPVQNLPLARVKHGNTPGAIVAAIGDDALLIPAAIEAGWGKELAPGALSIAMSALNVFAGRPPDEWRAVRLALSDALSDPSWAPRLEAALVPRSGLEYLVPFQIYDYSDFYASIHHATNVGSMFRPDNPLLPNYKWVPIGYHGRASSIVISGTPVRRPQGQTAGSGGSIPVFGPTKSLDYELEVGIFIGGRNALGIPVPAAAAANRIFGLSLLNDWSARDIQAWEYQPLGPFLAKSFATSVSPWVVTADALLPFRRPMPQRPEGDPAPLEHLRIEDDWTVNLDLTVELRSIAMREAGAAGTVVSRVNFADAMYWSAAQLITHHASNGCNLYMGDLLGTGTVSGPEPDSRGCLLERTWRGRDPLLLAGGESRRFLEDGDEVVFRGRCVSEGAVSIGFGECTGTVLPA